MHIRNLIVGLVYVSAILGIFIGGIFASFQLDEYIRSRVDFEIAMKLNTLEKQNTVIVAPTNIYDDGYSPDGEYYNNDALTLPERENSKIDLLKK